MRFAITIEYSTAKNYNERIDNASGNSGEYPGRLIHRLAGSMVTAQPENFDFLTNQQTNREIYNRLIREND